MTVVLLLVSAALAAAPAPRGIHVGQVAEELAGGPALPSDGLVDHLHLLGFSPDGKLASYTDVADEAVGGYLWDFAVQDLTTDRVLVARRWDHDAIETLLDRTDVLREHGPAFHQDLRAQGVMLDRDLAPQPLPWTWQDHTYTVRFAPLPRGEDEWVARADVFVAATGLGEKKVGTVEWADLGECCGRPTAVLVKSPHEDRAALIVSAWNRGWEGPPNVLKHTIFGVHLTERFEPAAAAPPAGAP